MKQTGSNFNVQRDRWREVVADDERISPGAFRVAFIISSYIREGSTGAFPSQETIAARLRVSARAVRGYVSELIEGGYLDVVKSHGRGRLNRYTLNLSNVLHGGENRNSASGLSRDENRNGVSSIAEENRNGSSSFEGEKPEQEFLFPDRKTGTDVPQTEAQNRINRVDKTGTAVPPETLRESLSAKAAQGAPEAELYRRGREVLGKNGGGLIKKLLVAKRNLIPEARAAIEVASLKHDPREYIGAVIRGAPDKIDARARRRAW